MSAGPTGPTRPTWTISSVRDALLTKKTSARELAEDFYAQIARRNPELNAFLALCPERAYAQADRVDAAIAKGHTLGPLRRSSGGHQGRAQHCRRAHHVWVEDPGELYATV